MKARRAQHTDAEWQPAGDGPYRISSIEAQRRNTARRSVFIDGEFAFGVSEEIYVKYALFKGRELSRAFIDEVRRADALYCCKQAALRAHGARLRSSAEMQNRLVDKGFAPDVVAETLAFMREYGMLDDAAYARAFVRDQLLKRPLGRRRLGDELRRRGLTAEEIAASLGEELDDQTELANAMAAASKKAPSIRQTDPRKREQSMANFLAGRGFGWDTISAVLKHLRATNPGGEDGPAEPFND